MNPRKNSPIKLLQFPPSNAHLALPYVSVPESHAAALHHHSSLAWTPPNGATTPRDPVTTTWRPLDPTTAPRPCGDFLTLSPVLAHVKATTVPQGLSVQLSILARMVATATTRSTETCRRHHRRSLPARKPPPPQFPAASFFMLSCLTGCSDYHA